MLSKAASSLSKELNSTTSAPRARGLVLVVDDALVRRDTIALALRAQGFEVVEAASTKEALEAAQANDVDAVLLNLAIPELQSFEVCRRLKAACATLLPVLYLSSRTSREARARALDAGFDGYLTHPFDSNELCATIGALIRLRRQESKRVEAAAFDTLIDDALDALDDHVALVGPSGEVVAVNRAWSDFAASNGHDSSGTGLGASYMAVCERALGVGAEDAAAADAGIKRVLAAEILSFELDYPCHSAGEERWYRMAVRRVTRPGPVAAIISHTDRTREHLSARAEASALALADSDRRRLYATLEALPVGVWLADAAGRIMHTNSAATRIWGGSAPHSESVAGYGVYRGWWGDTGEALTSDDWTLARTLREGKTFTDFLAIQRFDDSFGHLLNSAAAIFDAQGVVIGAVVVAVDISDRQAEARERERLVASLESERARLAMIFEEAPSFLAVLRGPEFVFERVNPAYQRLVGNRDCMGLTLIDALPELIGQGFVELLEKVRSSGEPFVGKQMPVVLPHTPQAPPEIRYVDQVYQRLQDASGEYSVVAHGVDVTDQVVVTEQLRQIDQRLRDQFAKLPVPTYLWERCDEDFVLLDCNEAALRAFPGFGTEAVGGMSRDFFPEMDSVRLDFVRCLAENVVVRRAVEFDAGELLGKRMLDLTIGPQRPDRVLVHALDTTDRAELEAQLRQAQKMDAVGRLAGGVAHDFNNLLTVIGAHSGFLLETLGSGDPRHEDAEAIHKAGIRAAGLTRQLLAFSRKQILKPAILALNETVEETQQMLKRLLGEDIEIAMHLAPELGAVIADASQIDQVLVNLAVNARDAMPDGGVLTIATSNVTIGRAAQGLHQRIPPGDYVLLKVADTGVGMSAMVQARLFEPFFTTKDPGKGTGLGLATVYGIVNQSAGYIAVESELGHGTTFEVYLPAVEHENELEELKVAENSSVRGVETILLIEDESAVRQIAHRILERQGYAVLLAASGLEALSISRAYEASIDLVISDSVMPGMTGAEVVRRLQEERPGLKALFMSGYTDDEILRRGIVSSIAAFIQKPFTLQDFSRATREALDS